MNYSMKLEILNQKKREEHKGFLGPTRGWD